MTDAHRPRSAQEKILSIDDLAAISAKLKADGETVVLCHGVFDLVHLGHIRHLEAAKREGTILIVTITADRFVNKGPGRPVFSENIRAEMLANLVEADYVGIVHEPSAVSAIRTIAPSVYVKGSDYAASEDDITGKIDDERAAVEAAGGRLAFTDDITFSSSSLINRFLEVHDPQLKEFLGRVREARDPQHFFDLIEKAADMRVLIVGDTIIDEYNYIVPLAKAPKENMIATHYQDQEVFAGGVIAAANHVASLCKEVEVITCLGGTDDYLDLIHKSLKPNVRLTEFKRQGRPTTRKARFIETGYLRKLFEVYYMDDSPLDGWELKTLNEMIAGASDGYDMVIVTDFGHGLIGPGTVEALCRQPKFLAINTQSNSGNLGFNVISKYPRADFVCIDTPEARMATRDRYSSVEAIVETKLPEIIDCDRVIVTHGRLGCVARQEGKVSERIPAFTSSVVDTVGAGDAFFAVTAPLIAAGADVADAAFVGNAAGAIKVGIVGHRESIEKVPLMKFITTLLK